MELQSTLPAAAPLVDASGRVTPAWQRVFIALLNRTGKLPGVDVAVVGASAADIIGVEMMAADDDGNPADPLSAALLDADHAQAQDDPLTVALLADEVDGAPLDQAALLALALEGDEAFDAPPRPIQAITPGASPYAYQAPFAGCVVVAGGTVSLLELSRDGAIWKTVGLTAGAIPVARLDRVRVTYTVAPTMTLFPR